MQVEHLTAPAMKTDTSQKPTGATKPLAIKILRIALQHRRLIPEHLPFLAAPTEACMSPHVPIVEGQIERNQPIHFIIPAFPAKSSNREKTLGPLPDLGERLGLSLLQDLCNRIREIYAPGARVTICSDGRVFSDLVRVTEEDVDHYRDALLEMMAELGADDIRHFELDELYPKLPYCAMREELLIEYGQPLASLRAELQKGNPEVRSMFNGIHRFIVEDYAVDHPDLSRSRLKEVCKSLAYRVIQRSNAWSRLVENKFSDSLRLSIHPQSAFSRKIGFMLVPCEDSWGTPWHNVVMIHNGRPLLVRRKYAEEQGASLISKFGRPSHYLLAHSARRLNSRFEELSAPAE